MRDGERIYPNLEIFWTNCDKDGIFRNNWLNYILALDGPDQEDTGENLFTSHSMLLSKEYPETTLTPQKNSHQHLLRTTERKNAAILCGLDKNHEKELQKLAKSQDKERALAFANLDKSYHETIEKKEKELDKEMKLKGKEKRKTIKELNLHRKKKKSGKTRSFL